MNLLRHLRHRNIRASATSNLQAAAAIPNSGFTFVDNAQGASAAVSELSKTLDIALDNVEFGENFRDLLQSQLDRLDEKAEEYIDSSLAGCKTKTKWICNQFEAEVIAIAWKCSLAVYNPTCTIQSKNIDFKVQDYVVPSADGSTKAVLFTLVNTTVSPDESKSFFPVLVVAVRGTASIVDGMVNANNHARNASKLFDGSEPSPLLQACKEAHAGFLHAAIALKETVFKHIDDLNRNDRIKHVLFTGHSAGGAVASLLCLSYQAYSNQNNLPLRSSCITFGSPPAACLQPTTKSFPIDDQGLWINIVNEYDLVARVDQSYVRSLVDLYRLIYGLPPIQEATSQNETLSTGTTDSGSNGKADEAKVSAYASGRAWIFPPQHFQHIGEMVVLQLERVAQNKPVEGAPEIKDQVALTAWKVPQQEFIKLLFCRVAVHSRRPYQERIDMIARGCFNGKEGWFQ